MRKLMISMFSILSTLVLLILEIASCKHELPIVQESDSGFPVQIEAIMHKCTTAGCHTNQSKNGAGGLSLETWDNLFEGGSGGATVIPYRAEYSTLLYYTNTDTTKGLTLIPTMPYNAPPLSAHEYDLLASWVKDGAPDKTGYVKFSDYRDKAKLYICNRGCDVITVMDAAKGLAIRYVNVGKTTEIEAPSVVKVSPDKLHWYVAFNNGTVIQKFRTSDNVFLGELEIGLGVWSSITFTDDSKTAFLTDNQYLGKVTCINVESMKLISTYSVGFKYPMNACMNSAANLLYVTCSEGNYIYKVNISNLLLPVVAKISLEPGIAPSDIPTLNPYSVNLSHDNKTYFVSCKQSSELRIFQTSNDSLISNIPVGSNPAKMFLSTSTPYLFLSCMGAPGTVKQSAVYVINYQTLLPEAVIYAGHESRGIVMDEPGKKLYVANRNVSAGGPAAHHTSVCAGKNGYITVIDVNTLTLIEGFKKEISVDPYDMDIVTR